MTNGRGSAGNVIAALCSFFVPGLGQLVQGRLIAALLYFVLAGLLWFILLGWLIHLLSTLDAALYRG
jgi:TM2 domain-containing membrane protein YozV